MKARRIGKDSGTLAVWECGSGTLASFLQEASVVKVLQPVIFGMRGQRVWAVDHLNFHNGSRSYGGRRGPVEQVGFFHSCNVRCHGQRLQGYGYKFKPHGARGDFGLGVLRLPCRFLPEH
jgi:hypothetical protein